jgi:hypothetical protein
MSKKGIFSIATGGSKSSSTPDTAAGSDSLSDDSNQGGVDDSPFARDPGEDSSSPSVGGGEPFKMNGFGASDDQDAESANDSPFKTIDSPQGDYEAAKANLEPQQDFAAVGTPFKPAVASMGDEADSDPSPSDAAADLNDGDAGSQAQVSIEPPAAVPAATPAPFQMPSSTPAQQNASDSPGMEQLEIRAIFGVDHLLDANEMIQRARSLSGIGTVAAVGAAEQRALTDFRSAVKTLGLGDPDQMELTFGSGSVDFICEGGTTLAVLQQGPYAPGVKETLIIVARELNKLA